MIFKGLTDRFQGIFTKLRRKGRVGENDLALVMREIKLALLEADVNFKVVKQFVAQVSEQALGQDVLKSLTPGQQVIKVVKEQLTALMGGNSSELSDKKPLTIMLVGLQGSGKTTTAAKLATFFKNKGRKPYLIAGDIYRPAAIDQLQQLGKEIAVPVFAEKQEKNVSSIVAAGLKEATAMQHDVIIIDTAGRLQLDDQMMKELEELKINFNPQETLLVVDAMTGQETVNITNVFQQRLTLSGVILTKLDSDTRGGAALSIKASTGCPIKFIGTGEKTNNLDFFYPDRMASRILGMGDMLSLIEKAEATIEKEAAEEMKQKLRKNSFTLEDFLAQMKQMRKMGPLGELLGNIPGIGQKIPQDAFNEKKLDEIEAIIYSMTPLERKQPEIINASRRKRIAKGSGTTIVSVNRLLKQFGEFKNMLKKMGGLFGKKKGLGLGNLFKMPFRNK